MNYKLEQIQKAIEAKKYKWFADRPNIIGIRTNQDLPNQFNDALICAFPWKEKMEFRQWVITTDPGIDYLKDPLNKKGCSILKPGQYVDCYALGLHQNRQDHRALVQIKPVTVFRDDDKDINVDFGVEDTGLFGINIHRANSKGITSNVGKWSAGCQVFKSVDDHERLIWVCDQFKEKLKNKFTYTLLTDKDL